MKRKFTFAIILITVVLLSCFFVACDDGKNPNEEETAQRLVLPEFSGEKVSYDKDGILTELNNYAFTQTIMPTITTMIQNSNEVSAFVSKDETAVVDYEKALKDSGFLFGDEGVVDGSLVKMYYNTFYAVENDEKIFTTQYVYIMLNDEGNVVLYYEDVYKQIVYKMPVAQDVAEFGFGQFPDIGDGEVIYSALDKYHPFGLVASVEVTVRAKKSWYDELLNVLYDAGYEDYARAETVNTPEEKAITLCFEKGKEFYQAELYAYAIDSEMEINCRIFSLTDEMESRSGKTVWYKYDKATVFYEENVSYIYKDSQKEPDESYTASYSISFDEDYITYRIEHKNKDDVNIEYYDIAGKNSYGVVNRGHNRELINSQDYYHAFEYFNQFDKMYYLATGNYVMSATGVKKDFNGITLYEYKGKEVFEEEVADVVSSSITVWKDENNVLFAVETEIEYQNTIEKRSCAITSVSTECAPNVYATLPLAYIAVPMPYDIITDYYGDDVMLDEIQGASGYYVEYIEKITWDDDGNEIRSIVPKLFALGVSDEELIAHKEKLSQKYTQIYENTWSLKVAPDKKCYLTLRKEYMQNNEINLLYEFSYEYLTIPDIFKVDYTSSVQIDYEIYDYFGDTERYLFIRKDDYFIIYNVADFTDTVEEWQEKFVSYNIRIAVKKTGEDSYSIVNSQYYDEIGRVLSLEEVIDIFSDYGDIFTFVKENLVENGSVEICSTQTTLYENQDKTGKAFARYAFSDEYGILLQSEDIINGNWNCCMKTLSVEAFDESFGGAGVLPDNKDLYVYEILHNSVSGETRTLKGEDFSFEEFESYLEKIQNNGLYIYDYWTGIENIVVSAIDRGYYYLNITYYTQASRIEITENIALESQTEIMGIEIYRLENNDVAVLGEGWYKTVSDSDSNGEIQHIENEIYYSPSAIYSDGKWTFLSDERIYTVADTESGIGTLRFYNAERSDYYSLNEYLNVFYLGDFSANYDYSAMVSDGMATIGAETLDGRECTTYSVFDNDNKLIRKIWVDNQTGIIFKRYGYTVIVDKDYTSIHEYTTTLTLLSGQEAPRMPDYSTALFTNKSYANSEWTDDMLISPSVVRAENFDSFEIEVYSDTLATFAFYGENVGLADNPEDLPGYVSLGDESAYSFYDEQTGESFSLNINYGDNGYGIKILYIQIELNISGIK